MSQQALSLSLEVEAQSTSPEIGQAFNQVNEQLSLPLEIISKLHRYLSQKGEIVAHYLLPQGSKGGVVASLQKQYFPKVTPLISLSPPSSLAAEYVKV